MSDEQMQEYLDKLEQEGKDSKQRFEAAVHRIRKLIS